MGDCLCCYRLIACAVIRLMGNNEFCQGECGKVDANESTVPFKESACIELIDNLPQVRGKFNFSKQASFNKIERAASQYCANNRIERMHVPIIARLIAYQQNHYFEAIRQLPEARRESFVHEQQEIDVELMDSLYYYFVVKHQGKVNPRLFLGSYPIIDPPLINLPELKQDHLEELCSEGLELLSTGKLALVLMAAGSAEESKSTSKVLAPLPLPGNPRVIEMLMRRYTAYLKDKKGLSSKSAKLSQIDKLRPVPVVVICSSHNFVEVRKVFELNDYFGLEKTLVKLVTEDRSIPLIGQDGRLCLSQKGRTLSRPAGTAMAISKVVESTLKETLLGCGCEYVHFIGCENLMELPGDPVMLGLMHRFNRQIGGKCVDSGGGMWEEYPRYVATKAAFHLLDAKELSAIDVGLGKSAPVALNSVMFRLRSLIEFYHDFETNLYIAKRFHMKEVGVEHFDFERGERASKGRVFSFEQDIRDYTSASTQAIVVKYRPQHFVPLRSPGDLKQLKPFGEPRLY